LLIPAALLLGGCGVHSPPPLVPSGSAAPPGVDDVAEPWTLVKAFTHARLPVAHARDTPAQRCPAIGCTGAVATDAVSVLVFGKSRDAQLYEASSHDSYQIADVVLEFAPTDPSAQRAAYEHIVERAVS